MFPKPASAAIAALSICLTVGMYPVAASADTPVAANDDVGLFFVQTADNLMVDSAAGTLRLVHVNPETLYFSDRPARLAGQVSMAEYLQNWTVPVDNFGKVPPNATLSVHLDGQQQNTIAIVKIFDPKVEGKDISYNYELIKGEMPATGGATTLFIDRIGVGGGVGAGYHGVGVGARGPGVTGWAGVAARTSVDAAYTGAAVVGATAVAVDASTTNCVTTYNAYGQKITTCN